MAETRGKIRVLAVEDVPMMLELLRQLLQPSAEFEWVGGARTVTEARVLLSKHRPDLVLLDEVLPGESSHDFLRELLGQGIPVIGLTGISDPEHEAGPGSLGRISKPSSAESWAALDAERARLTRQILELMTET